MSQQVQKIDVNTASARDWEKWWWADFNELCKKCERSCKQSWQVKLSCPQFKNIQN